MAERKRVDIWASLFGGRRSFDMEIKIAKEIGAKWEIDGHQRNIIADQIPGWLEPLWGTDGNWLYLRRPEGVWKTRIPDEFQDSTPIFLCQRLGGDIVGMLSLGKSMVGCKGWIRGHSIENPMDAADMDDMGRHESLLVDADVYSSGWGNALGFDGEEILVDGGGHFDKLPRFKLQGDWLIAEDVGSGRRVAYPLDGYQVHRKALEDGDLWMVLGSKWSKRFEVKIDLEK